MLKGHFVGYYSSLTTSFLISFVELVLGWIGSSYQTLTCCLISPIIQLMTKQQMKMCESVSCEYSTVVESNHHELNQLTHS